MISVRSTVILRMAIAKSEIDGRRKQKICRNKLTNGRSVGEQLSGFSNYSAALIAVAKSAGPGF